MSDFGLDDHDHKIDVLTDALQERELQKKQEDREARTGQSEGQTTDTAQSPNRTKEDLLNSAQSVEPSQEYPRGVAFLPSDDKSESGSTKTAGGGTKSYDQENYTGNIPDEVKKTMDYFRQQALAQKPQSGGETVHTDDSATGGTITGGSVSNLVAQQGNLGLLGNPGSATSQNGLGGGQGHVGSSQSGGNIDPGPDSDSSGYTGITHQDDPGDIQFGSQEPVVKDGVESKNSNDENKDSNDLTDPLNRNRKKVL